MKGRRKVRENKDTEEKRSGERLGREILIKGGERRRKRHRKTRR